MKIRIFLGVCLLFFSFSSFADDSLKYFEGNWKGQIAFSPSCLSHWGQVSTIDSFDFRLKVEKIKDGSAYMTVKEFPIVIGHNGVPLMSWRDVGPFLIENGKVYSFRKNQSGSESKTCVVGSFKETIADISGGKSSQIITIDNSQCSEIDGFETTVFVKSHLELVNHELLSFKVDYQSDLSVKPDYYWEFYSGCWVKNQKPASYYFERN